jgi:hypothetical protein
MNGNNVSIILLHEVVNVLAKLIDHIEVRRLMIIEPEVLALLIKGSLSVTPLTA